MSTTKTKPKIAVIGFHYHHIDGRRGMQSLIELSKHPVHVDVIACTHWIDFKDEHIYDQENKNLKIHLLKPKYLSKESHQFRFYMKGLYKKLKEINPDVIYMVNEPIALNTLSGLIAAKRLNKPFVCFSWENLYRKRFFPIMLFDKLMHKIIPHYIGGTDDVKKLLLKKGVPSKKILATFPHNGIDTKQFNPNEKPISSPKLDKSKTCIFTGQLEDFKGIPTILEAKKILENRGKKYTYLFVGKGSWLDRLTNLAKKDLHLKIIGYVARKDITPYYCSASVFLYPQIPKENWEEQYGYGMVEAMACGLPVIASDMSGPNAIISQGKDGYIIQPKDATQLAQHIQDILDHQQTQKQLSQAAIAKAQTLSNSAIAKQLYHTLKKIIPN